MQTWNALAADIFVILVVCVAGLNVALWALRCFYSYHLAMLAAGVPSTSWRGAINHVRNHLRLTGRQLTAAILRALRWLLASRSQLKLNADKCAQCGLYRADHDYFGFPFLEQDGS